MLELYILRHGKAQKPQTGTTDFNRKLNKKGVAQINQVGHILQEKTVSIDQIITSGAQRTLETAEIMNFYLNVPHFKSEDLLYLTDRSNLTHFLNVHSSSKRILLIGHNFGLSDFGNYLTGSNLLLSTGMLVQINFNFDDWSLLNANSGKIVQTITPKVHTL